MEMKRKNGKVTCRYVRNYFPKGHSTNQLPKKGVSIQVLADIIESDGISQNRGMWIS